jgi:single-strand DNA-binding protein
MGINKVILVGYVHGKTQSGHQNGDGKFISFQLKTLEKISRNPHEKRHEEYHHINIPAHLLFGENKLFREDQLIWLEGKIRTRSKIGSDGIKRYTTEIMVTRYNLIS